MERQFYEVAKLPPSANVAVLQRNQASFLPAEITAGLMDQFIRYLDTSPKTIETYTRALRQFAKWLQARGIRRPERADVLAFREDLKASGHKPTTIQSYLAAVKVFFRWTEQQRYYPNIADHLKGAKLDRAHKKDYLTGSQVRAVLEAVQADQSPAGVRDYAMLSLMVTGGLRTIEVSRANIEDLRTIGNDCVLYVQGKGREEKTDYIKLSAPAEKALRLYLSSRSDKDPTGPLFCSTSNRSKGARLSTRSISGIVKSRLQAAGYDSPRLTAHSLRHTAVTLALLSGEKLEDVQQFARHANLNTTMIYNHAIDAQQNTCSASVSAAIFGH